jgi:hypothetical protein
MRPKTRDQRTTNTALAAAHFLHSRYVGLIINYVIPHSAALFFSLGYIFRELQQPLQKSILN